MYQFKYEELKFGRGSLAELIAYDRYAITSNGAHDAREGDIILFKHENRQLVGTVIDKNNDYGLLTVEAHDGSGNYTVDFDECRLIKEAKPVSMWNRWAKGAASVESESKRRDVEEDFRWLLDGYRYVPGGRIQTMLGREFSTIGEGKSKLSAYNCLVLPSPDCNKDKSDLENWLEIIKIAKREANSMAYGCGVGINISTVPEEIKGPMRTVESSVLFYLDSKHVECHDDIRSEFSHMRHLKQYPSVEANYHVVTVEDSRFGIFDALAEMVKLLYTTNDYTVLDFSNLRPKGAYVKGIDGVSSGAISWMKLFDFMVGLLSKSSVDVVDVAEFFALIPNLISQGGQRRGALMEVLDADHPNIIKFIKAKQEAGRITGANLSVNITKKFMDAVENGLPYESKVYDFLAESAHKSGEPGVLFMDTVNELSNTSYYQTFSAVNPCGEATLPPDGVCNLGHHNLPMYLKYDEENKEWYLGYDALNRAIHTAVRFQDNIVDYTSYFDDEIKAVQMGDRRIGIGTMGLATVLIKLGYRYGSKEAEEFADELFKFIAEESYRASISLGEEKGSFPNYKASEIPGSSFLYKIMKGKIPKYLRNAALLTQAPTGSTGTMIDNLPGYNCSTGIEPYFSFEYYRAGRLGVAKQEVALVKEYKKEHPDAKLPDYFVCAQDIEPEGHIRMQSAIQKYVDAAISKTVNLPADASVEDIKEVYKMAYYGRCKGVTVYRDGSRAGQVLAVKKEDAKLEEDKVFVEVKNEVPSKFKKRPGVLFGRTVKQNTPMGKMYVTVNTDSDNCIEEVFLNLGKVGSDVRAITDALGILLTLSLSERLSKLTQDEKLNWLISKLIGIKGANPMGMGPNRVDSLPDALGRVIRDYKKSMEDYSDFVGEVVSKENSFGDKIASATVSDICPSCGAAAVVKVEGCQMCRSCGDSKCS